MTVASGFDFSSSSSFSFSLGFAFAFGLSSFLGEDFGVGERVGDDFGVGLGEGFGVALGVGVAFGLGLEVGFGVGVTVGREVGVAFGLGLGLGLGVEIGSSDRGARGGDAAGIAVGVDRTGGGVAGGGVAGGGSSSGLVSGCGSSWSSERDTSLGAVTVSWWLAIGDSVDPAFPPNDPGFIQTTVSLFFFDSNRVARSNPPSRTKWTAAMDTKVFLKPPSGSSLR